MLTVTATDLPRLMACNGSRLMGDHVPPIDRDDTIRNEGNAADWIVTQVYNGISTVEQLIGQKAPNGIYITAEMLDHLEEYLKAVIGGLIEVDTICAGETWQVNGRADLIKYDRDKQHLYVGDLKYGWGIVEPKNNWTLIAHAVGHALRNGLKVSNLTLTIYQPRPYHPSGTVRSYTYDGIEFGCFYPRINAILSNPSDILNTGSHCYKCPAHTVCPAARKAESNGIEASEKAFVNEIDNDNLSFQLDHLNRAMKVLKQAHDAYSELALHRTKQGQIINNYGLETDLANNTWYKHINADMLKVLTGKDLTKNQLITPAQAKKAGVSEIVVATLTERRNKGVKLVRVNADTKASKMFERL